MNRFLSGKRAALCLATALAVTQLSGCFPIIAAGVGTGVAVATDRRTASTILADQQIMMRISQRISAVYGSNTHININSYNHTVLLTGEAPDETIRADIEKIARTAEDVKRVYNEVTVSLPSTFVRRTNDAGLTTKIKARLTDSQRVSPLNIKVTTERSVAFLMGQVTQDEAKAAVEIVSQTSGIERVMTYFEYTD